MEEDLAQDMVDCLTPLPAWLKLLLLRLRTTCFSINSYRLRFLNYAGTNVLFFRHHLPITFIFGLVIAFKCTHKLYCGILYVSRLTATFPKDLPISRVWETGAGGRKTICDEEKLKRLLVKTMWQLYSFSFKRQKQEKVTVSCTTKKDNKWRGLPINTLKMVSHTSVISTMDGVGQAGTQGQLTAETQLRDRRFR